MQDYSSHFSPAYAQQYLFPYRQVDPNITYPGPSITHTVGQGQNGALGQEMVAAGGLLMGGIGLVLGALLYYVADKAMKPRRRRRRR